MKRNYTTMVIAFLSLLTACGEKGPKPDQSPIKELSDAEYPDNNDIESRSSKWDKFQHHLMQVDRHGEKDFTVIFFPSNEHSDTIKIEHINLLEWMPTIPDHITDKYLKDIGIINAEWNRQQVKFNKDEFYISKNNDEGKTTVRVDLARNCLNSYLWEIITFSEEDGKQKPLYHGWFDFPHILYQSLFNEKNRGKLSFSMYQEFLLQYKHPSKKTINFDNLREVVSERSVSFEDFRHEFYPLTGARKSKYKNIVCPKNPSSINQLLTDSTTFSTFQYPGYYDTKDPRPTMLSMLGIPKEVIIRETISKNNLKESCYEFEVIFMRNTDSTFLTKVVIGGVRKTGDLKQLNVQDYNDGYKMPMGIGNHPFYQSASECQRMSSSDSPYYAFIIGPDNTWMDSHFFGVDGPLFHLDENNPEILHYWLLSFERHAMVAHLTFNLSPVDSVVVK